MDISQAETGTMALVRQPVRLGQVVDEAIALYADEAEDRSIAVALDGAGLTSAWMPTTRGCGRCWRT